MIEIILLGIGLLIIINYLVRIEDQIKEGNKILERILEKNEK